MFRRLTENDRPQCLEYLSREPAYNVFIFGDIENFGFECDFQDVWADFDESGFYRAVVLRFYNHFIVYSEHERCDYETISQYIGLNQAEWILSGKVNIVQKLNLYLSLTQIREQYLAALTSRDVLFRSNHDIAIEWVKPETIPDLIELQKSIDEFHDLGDSTKSFRHNIETGTGRSVLIRHGSKAVSTASSAAENSRSAMIVGVCTLPEYRNHGYATLCMEHLCRALLDENKIACLFYDNPAAGRIYRRMGFRDAGLWAMGSAKTLPVG